MARCTTCTPTTIFRNSSATRSPAARRPAARSTSPTPCPSNSAAHSSPATFSATPFPGGRSTPTGSTVTAKYGGVLADAHDTWSGPTDLCVGPDGAIYVSDFYDQRTAHPDPDANWDRSNGRIYKITAIDATSTRRKSTWQSYPAMNWLICCRTRIIGMQTAPALSSPIAATPASSIDSAKWRPKLQTTNSPWKGSGHSTQQQKSTTNSRCNFSSIRIPTSAIGRSASLAIATMHRPKSLSDLPALAANEPSPSVRGQLAATAKRLPGTDCLRIVESLLRNQPHESDPRVPWLIWWAFESKAMTDTQADCRRMLATVDVEQSGGPRVILLLIRRYAAEGTAAGYDACAKILAPRRRNTQTLRTSISRKGLAERAVGLQGIGQGDLYGEQAAGADDETDCRSPPLRAVDARTKGIHRRHSGNSNATIRARLELALRAGVDGAYPELKAAASAT